MLHLKILQNSLENIREAVFNFTKFHAKSLQLHRKDTPAYVIS